MENIIEITRLDVDDDYQDLTPMKKYKKYDVNTLNLAVEDKKKNNVSFTNLSKKYKIPATTIYDHFHGKLKLENGEKRGPKPVLYPEEEMKISTWVKKCSKMGDPRTCDDLCTTASEVRQSRQDSSTPIFKNAIPSPFWVKKFMIRNQDISIRKPETITRAAANVTEGRIRNFFENVYSYFEENGILSILERPEAIVNLDESAFELNPSLKRVLAEKGSKNVYSVESGKGKESITVTFAFTANGKTLAPQIIYKNSFSKMGDAAYMSGKVNGKFVFCQTANGWQTKESFAGYLKLLIDEMDDVPKPIVFLFDNHSSHINMELFKYCQERDVHIITFPPNTTHILQMADVGMFGPAKASWKKEMHLWRVENHDKLMDEVKFIPLLKKVMDTSLTKDKILSGFKATGIYPFDMNQVDYKKCLGADNSLENIDENQPSDINENDYGNNYPDGYEEYLENEDQNMVDKYEEDFDNEILQSLEQNQIKEKYPFRDEITSKDGFNECYPEYSSDKCQDNQVDNIQELVIERIESQITAECPTACDVGNTLGTDKNDSSVESPKEVLNSYLSIIQKCSHKVKDLLNSEFDGKCDLNTSILIQQCEFIQKAIETEFPTQNETKSIDQILKVPEKYKRKTNRVYKQKQFGPMTDKKILAFYDEQKSIMEREDEEKEERRLKREEKKAIKLNEIKIKKEKVEAAIRDSQKKTVSPKKLRGRPKKIK